ncbi:hypothetical protein PV08_02010 [Exophiala spinifera]|uniref:Major facilitator superfamily (MFS) profile domain-containing protein n=1 Tax=Exophiala spinifera TaxID=91928 RepID=A0A0D2BSM8_9EURO|nr:uncharacterized protein PV08_02010 [Exophiala spinifera]KIW21430.1 hypothetical protein PV08_02010 [Exophiala spinifera]
MSKEAEAVVVGDGLASDPVTQQRSWKSYVWDTFDKPAEERKFLFKLDAAILTFTCLGYFSRFLDQANINNAYVSGMKEDLNMLGNQYNYATTLWTVGYIIGEIPSNLILTKVRPSIWIPALELVWSTLTICTCRVTTVNQLYGLRFLVGLAEAGFFPGILYMLGSWYGRDELAKRSVIFHVSGSIATMFSGYLMSAVIGLGGRHGYAGWQWLFIIDGVISFPIALLTFFFLPDQPHNTRAWYLNARDKEIALERVKRIGRASKEGFSKEKLVKIFSRWHIWVFPLMTVFGGGAGGIGQPMFSFYLKASKHPKYTISQINNYPTATAAVMVVAELLYSWISDGPLNGKRWPVMVFASIFQQVIWISLLVWDIPKGWLWFCYIVMQQGIALVPLNLIWVNEVCSDDMEERALVLAVVNTIQYTQSAWLPLLIWKVTDAPQYKKGFPTAIAFTAVVTGVIFLIRHLANRENRRKKELEDRLSPGLESNSNASEDVVVPK